MEHILSRFLLHTQTVIVNCSVVQQLRVNGQNSGYFGKHRQTLSSFVVSSVINVLFQINRNFTVGS